jgi:hypothetical protein
MLKKMMIFLLYTAAINAQQMNISFDSLFPMTWYQKGLESSMYVWSLLLDVFEKKSDAASLSFDTLLSRLAFAQFCVNRMNQDRSLAAVQDTVYFARVLHKVKSLLDAVSISAQTHDFVLCADDLISQMQQNLKQ